jgi:NAD-dependent protein deacetylase/lipoamidase
LTAPPREPKRLRLGPESRLLVLTGAGVSAESGIPTFRASNGLWESYPVEKVASPEGFEEDPELVWRFYSERRLRARECRPNPGHEALASAEARLGDRFLLVTQNVDGLHARAGSRRLVEIHGNLFETRCATCGRAAFRDEKVYLGGTLPRCEICERSGRPSLLRPNIVWFGEMLDPLHLARVEAFLEEAEGHPLVYLAVGTSGVVYPAAGLVSAARARGAETWLVNAEPPDNVRAFDVFVPGPSGRILPELLAD